MGLLTRDFYDRDTVTVARDLLGKRLERWGEDGTRLACLITETEAYVGPVDRACHAYGYRRTPRTQTLFAGPGTAYIYLIYGMYHCLNFVTEPEGTPCAVLIRGAVPAENADAMAWNRFGCPAAQMSAGQRRNFLNGPGKLCQGLALTRELNGVSLTDPAGPIRVLDAPGPGEIQVGRRIGIDYAGEAAEFPWRFWYVPERQSGAPA